jgi:hypothetical protein
MNRKARDPAADRHLLRLPRERRAHLRPQALREQEPLLSLPDPPLPPPRTPQAPAQGDQGRASPLHLLPGAVQGPHGAARGGHDASPAGRSDTSGRPSAPASRPRRRSTHWPSYLFGDGPEGRDQIREIDRTIAEVPGLAGVDPARGLLERRARAGRDAPETGRGAQGPRAAAAATNGHSPAPAPTHWAWIGAARDD